MAPRWSGAIIGQSGLVLVSCVLEVRGEIGRDREKKSSAKEPMEIRLDCIAGPR